MMKARAYSFAITLSICFVSYGLLALAASRHDHHVEHSHVPADKRVEARALKNPLADTPELLSQGQALYQANCANCHGPRGGGDGPIASNLVPAPRNFQQREFWQHRSEGEIFWVIKNGIKGSAMPPFGNSLTDREVWTLVSYLPSFTNRTKNIEHEHGQEMNSSHRHHSESSH